MFLENERDPAGHGRCICFLFIVPVGAVWLRGTGRAPGDGTAAAVHDGVHPAVDAAEVSRAFERQADHYSIVLTGDAIGGFCFI